MSRRTKPAREEPSNDSRPASSSADPGTGTDQDDGERTRMAMTLREAKIIARNLKESGTRR